MPTVAGIEDLIDFPRDGRVISWLPAAHVAERNAHHYLPIVFGLQITCCDDPREVLSYLPEVRPSWFFAVPRIWEKLKAGLETMVAGQPEERREQLQGALDAAVRKVRLEQAGEPVPPELAEQVATADAEIFAGLRTMLGLDQVEAINVGAAPTPVEVLEFFHAIGLPLAELWGMSETCGAGSVNPPGKIKLGTVGPPAPAFEIKLDTDGEVLVKSDVVMLGYRNLPEKTAETFTEDGWLRTGDIGVLRRGRLPDDRRSQEGADHQRRRQEHVAGEHRGDGQERLAADRPGVLHRRPTPLQHRADRARRRLRAGVGRRSRASRRPRSRRSPAMSACAPRCRRASTPPTRSSRGSNRSRGSRSSPATGCRAATS